MADESKKIPRIVCNLIRMMFKLNESKGKNVYGSRQKNTLDCSHVEQIKQILITVYRETKVTEKVWVECITSMNSHL